MASVSNLSTKNHFQLRLVVDYLSISVAFRMTVSILLRAKECYSWQVLALVAR